MGVFFYTQTSIKRKKVYTELFCSFYTRTPPHFLKFYVRFAAHISFLLGWFIYVSLKRHGKWDL